MTAEGSRPIVVVGVDGSQASQDALRWAARHAELTGAELRAVMAWRPSITGVLPDYTEVPYEADARDALRKVVDEVLGTDQRVRVTTHVAKGHPAQVLVDAAHGADLLVVGSHGYGAFAGMLLGSVGQHCVQHATCSVLVARHATP